VPSGLNASLPPLVTAQRLVEEAILIGIRLERTQSDQVASNVSAAPSHTKRSTRCRAAGRGRARWSALVAVLAGGGPRQSNTSRQNRWRQSSVQRDAQEARSEAKFTARSTHPCTARPHVLHLAGTLLEDQEVLGPRNAIPVGMVRLITTGSTADSVGQRRRGARRSTTASPPSPLLLLRSGSSSVPLTVAVWLSSPGLGPHDNADRRAAPHG